MNLDIIDHAIQRHQSWVAEFNAALAQAGTKEFDLDKVRDDTACALGQWFKGAPSVELLGMDFHTRASAIHAAFHEISGEVINSLRAGDPPDVTQALIAALEDLSKSLIEFLEFAKKRLLNLPVDWKV